MMAGIDSVDGMPIDVPRSPRQPDKKKTKFESAEAEPKEVEEEGEDHEYEPDGDQDDESSWALAKEIAGLGIPKVTEDTAWPLAKSMVTLGFDSNAPLRHVFQL